jgi:hypothetical protein
MEDKGMIGPAKGSKPREVYGSELTEEVGSVATYSEE